MGPEYESFDAVGLADLVRRGEVHPRDLVAAAAERIERLNPALNAVVFERVEAAMAEADGPLPDGPLRGVPFLLKDLMQAYAGAPLTSGSRSLRGYVPTEHSELVRRYLAAGVLVVGKTNVPEFGLAPVTESELHGPARNPWDQSRTTGGSSGGSAAAVASGMVPAAHGSDGGGSIRIPASHCGLFGLKPTRGRVPAGPRYGEGWFGMSVDNVLTRTVRDAATFLDAVAGVDVGAPYASPPRKRPYAEEVGTDPGRLRVAFTTEPLLGPSTDAECVRAVEEAAGLLEGMGHSVEKVEVPVEREAWTQSFLVLAAAGAAFDIAESARLTGRERPSRDDYELVTWVLGLIASAETSGDMAEALHQARRAGRVMGAFFQRYDVLVTSTMGRPPWPIGDLDPSPAERALLRGLRRLPLKRLLLGVLSQLGGKVLEPIPNTPLFNMTGQPAMTVPLHWTEDGLPVGVQVVGRFGDEATLFRLGAALEEARPWFDRRPPV